MKTTRPVPTPLAWARALRPGAAPRLPTEGLILLACLFFVAASNGPFWQAALAHEGAQAWGFIAGTAVALVALHFIALGLLLTRHSVRPVLSVLFVTAAVVGHYMGRYGTVIDADMLRNTLHTDWKEARELLTPAMLWPLAWQAVLPIVLLWRVQVTDRPWASAARRRGLWLGAALLLAASSLWLVFQDVSGLLHNNKPVRYLVTPGNVMYGLGRMAFSKRALAATQPRQVVAADAHPGPAWAAGKKPLLFVFVVGETARAANWGLNGYARQNTPELAALNVINFSDVTSCGTHTEASLPCMFSPYGRRHYDEDLIRSHESLLHVLKRAGFQVLWRDNQSGCKGVCDGLPTQTVSAATLPGLCKDGLCFDEVLLNGLGSLARDAHGNVVLVLHPLGNHGPAYFKRYPDAFRRYTPACETGELSHCSRAEIVNAYDNAIAYTDHLLAATVHFLQGQADRFDTAMLYVSDHGESLGENKLFLHGMPYAIAPEVQKHVPMVWWLSPGFSASAGVNDSCLRARAQQAASHDHLFHTVLGLLDVQTSAYEPAMDLSSACRSAPTPAPTPLATTAWAP